MNVKDFLYSVRNEACEIKELKMRIEDLENQATGLRGISYDSDRVQTSPQDSMSSKIVELVNYKDQLSSKINDLNLRRQKAQAIIDTLPETRERQVLDLYFLSEDKLRMYEVAQIMNYSQQQTYEYYRRGLIHLNSVVNQS